MSKEFTEREKEILLQVAQEVEEFYVESRKGRQQTKYVMEVKGTYDDWENYNGGDIEAHIDIPIPDHLVGTWMMAYPCDLEYDGLEACIKRYDWVKCKQVEQVVKVWEEIDE